MNLLELLRLKEKKRSVGTLTLGQSNAFREVFFEDGLVYLCEDSYSGRFDVVSLHRSGLLNGYLSSDRLERTLIGDDLRSTILPQVLHRQGVLDDPAVLDRLAVAHVLEELLEILVRCRESFSFQEGRVPERLLSADALAARAPVPLSQLIDAYTRRLEERRRIRALLPSLDEVFVLTAEGMKHRQDTAADYATQRILGLVDGFRDLRTIVDAARFFEHFTLARCVEFLEQSFLKKTVVPELRGMSTSKLSLEECRKALVIVKRAVKHSVDELAARERLARLHERLGELDEAVVQYNFVGDTLYRMGRAASAIKAYHRARTLKPDEVLVSDKISRIYYQAALDALGRGDREEAAQLLENSLRACAEDWRAFEKLAEIRASNAQIRELCELCDRLVERAAKAGRLPAATRVYAIALSKVPQHRGLQRRLINAYLDVGEIDQARTLLEDLAAYHLENQENEKALEVVEKLLRIGPETDELRRLRRRLLGTRPSKSNARAKNRKMRWALPLSLLLAVLVYQGWSYVAWRDIEGEKVVSAGSEADAEAPDLERIVASEAELQLTGLAARCERFEQLFPLSFFTKKAQELGSSCRTQVRTLSLAREGRKRDIIDDARLLLVEGERDRVRSALEPLLDLPEDDEAREEALRILAEVDQVRRSSSEYQREAQRLEAAGRYRQAFENYRRLREEFPTSQYAKEIVYPILIESQPPGATVIDVARYDEVDAVLGTTPLVLRLAPGASREVELTLPGHAPLRARVTEDDGIDTRFVLLREPLETATLRGPPAQPPQVRQGLSVIAFADGVIELRDASRPDRVATYSRNAEREPVGAPYLDARGVFIAWNDGLVTRLTLDSAANELRAAAERSLIAEGFAIATTGLVAAGPQELALGTARKEVLFLEASSLRVADRFPLSARPIAILDLGGSWILVTTDDGSAQAVDASARKVVWRADLGELETPARLVKGVVVAVGRDRRLHLLDRASGEPLVPATKLAPGDRAVPDPGAGLVYVLGHGDELAAIDPHDGSVVAHRTLGFEPSELLGLSGRAVLVHGGRLGVLVLDGRTLAPLWATRADAPIVSLAASPLTLLASLTDRRLLVFDARPQSPPPEPSAVETRTAALPATEKAPTGEKPLPATEKAPGRDAVQDPRPAAHPVELDSSPPEAAGASGSAGSGEGSGSSP